MARIPHCNRRPPICDRGAVLMEAAIAIPLLITLLAGIINLGLGFVEQSELTEAVRSSGQLAYETQLVGDCSDEHPPASMCLPTLKTALTALLNVQVKGAQLAPNEFGISFQETVQSGSLQPYLRIQIHRISERTPFTDRFSLKPCASTLARLRFKGDTSAWPQVETLHDAC